MYLSTLSFESLTNLIQTLIQCTCPYYLLNPSQTSSRHSFKVLVHTHPLKSLTNLLPQCTCPYYLLNPSQTSSRPSYNVLVPTTFWIPHKPHSDPHTMYLSLLSFESLTNLIQTLSQCTCPYYLLNPSQTSSRHSFHVLVHTHVFVLKQNPSQTSSTPSHSSTLNFLFQTFALKVGSCPNNDKSVR